MKYDTVLIAAKMLRTCLRLNSNYIYELNIFFWWK